VEGNARQNGSDDEGCSESHFILDPIHVGFGMIITLYYIVIL